MHVRATTRVLGTVAAAACLLLGMTGGSAQARFALLPGAEGFGLSFTNRDGSPDTQAGSHPYTFTTSFAFSTNPGPYGPVSAGNVKDIDVELPPGLTGNPGTATKCLQSQLASPFEEPGDVAHQCPPSSQVGMVAVSFLGFISVAPRFFLPVYNMATAAGQPAVFGFNFLNQGIYIDTGMRTGGDYGLTSSLTEISGDFGMVASTLTLWGVPADPSHDAQRCIGSNELTGLCESAVGSGEAESEPHSAGISPKPFLSLPSACSGPQTARIDADSWQEPGSFVFGSFEMPGVTGCERLPFDPSFSTAPDSSAGGSPVGLGVDVRFPREEAPGGLAEADLKNAVVTLPAGTAVNPSGANGLGACSPEEIGLDNANPVSCPDSAKVGTVELLSPALANPLVGSVYVAQQGSNPFGSLLALYIVAEGEGVLIKSAGDVHLDPVTGQITTIFDNLPQQPVSEIELHLFGGPRAALVTPAGCGTYTTTSQFSPYSGTAPTEPASAFQIASGPNGSACGGQSFSPSFVAGTTNNQAGAFSPFGVSFSRSDEDQGLGGVTVKAPSGVLSILRGVERCGEPQAALGTCAAGSLIGHTTASAGAGSDPVSVGGQVFLTGPYKGAPFGLSIVVPAVAGPFNLGTVVVRAAVNVDPHTAQIVVTSDPLPTILQGIPLLLKSVNVTIDRPGFMFNPTDCEPLSVGGTLTSTQGASVGVSSRFQAANCAALGFKPSFKVSTQANTSKKQGASLDVKVGYPSGAQANIRGVAVTLPKQLPSRLTTIQQACPEARFAANPASCPAGSNIGTATASTPVLANPVTGPVYLVSHGGASFPDVVVILQGEGVTLELVGSIDIKKGVTSSTFASIPDAPISSFELSLPEGPHSALGAVLPAKAKGSLCGTALVMPTTLTGQNGAVVKQGTKIAVTGCPKARKKPKAKHKKTKAKTKTKKKQG
jgi:hypothetical protein